MSSSETSVRPRRVLFPLGLGTPLSLWASTGRRGSFSTAQRGWPTTAGHDGATVILDVATAQDRGRWMGLYQTWFFLGAALSAFAGGLLTDWLGYGATMWLGAATTALGGLIALTLLPETRSIRPDLDRPPVEEIRPRLRANWGLWVGLRGVYLLCAGLFAAGLALATLFRLRARADRR